MSSIILKKFCFYFVRQKHFRQAEIRRSDCLVSVCRKSIAEFSAQAENKIETIFCQGVYLTENTYQAASVEFVCHRQTNYARSRLQKDWRKSPEGFFDKMKSDTRTV